MARRRSLLLTQRQEEILGFIKAFTRKHGYPPTFRELGELAHIASTNGVNDHIKALVKKGRLTSDPMKARAIRVVGGEVA